MLMGLLLLRLVSEACQRRSQVLRCPLMNATGWLVQSVTLLEITTQPVDDIEHGFISCDSLSAMGPPCGPFHLKSC